MNINKLSIIALTLLLPFSAGAQKITLGSTTTKDGGEYQGETVMPKLLRNLKAWMTTWISATTTADWNNME